MYLLLLTSNAQSAQNLRLVLGRELGGSNICSQKVPTVQKYKTNLNYLRKRKAKAEAFYQEGEGQRRKGRQER